MVKVTKYDKDGNMVEEKSVDTKYDADEMYKPITAQKGDYSKKWGTIPFRNWRHARDNNGGL